MKHNKIEVEFDIFNNEVFDPNEITQRLKLEPKNTCVMGDPVPGTTPYGILKYKDTSWTLSSGLKESDSLSEELLIIENSLRDKTETIKSVLTELRCESHFMIVVYNYDREYFADMRISKEFLKLAAEIDAYIDYDIYFSKKSENNEDKKTLCKKIKQYLERYGLQKIGANGYIVVNPVEYVKFVSDYGYYVSKVSWWEHIEIENQKKSLGGGGPTDQQNNNFMYSEIYYLSENFSEDDTELCLTYLKETPELYKGHDLCPSFIISKR